ncbi:MAG: adenylate/guanylate cyclase domain-containing protein [Hyphomonadaceae bacterium]
MSGDARRLATIMAVDVAGYSRATEQDDVAAVHAISEIREALEGLAQRRRGRMFSTAGDGFMLEFASATEGLQATADLIGKRDATRVRVGLHLGEVLDGKDGDVLGHGVNIAARLQVLAAPGGAIVSKAVQTQARGVEQFGLKPLGEVRLDKMHERIEVYALGAAPDLLRLRWRSPKWRAAAFAAILSLGAIAGYFAWPRLEPSPADVTVAVSPFRSMNVGEDARLYAENISSSVASALTSAGLQVVSQTTPGSVTNARYLVNGEVRRDADTLSVMVQIADGRDGVTLISESLESSASEATALPGRISSRIGSYAWVLQVSAAGRANAALASGLTRVVRFQDAGDFMASYETARDLARQFPNEPMAHFLHAVNAGTALWELPTEEFDAAMTTARASARRSHQLAPRFGEAYVGDYLLTLRHKWAEREGYLRRALEVDPRTSNVSTYLSNFLLDVGRMQDAEPLSEGAVARDPFNTVKVGLRLSILLESGNREAAENLLADTEHTWPNHPNITSDRFWASSYAGNPSDAQIMLRDPALSEIIEPSEGPQPVHLMVRALATRNAGDIEAARQACAAERLRARSAPETCLVGLVMLGDLDAAYRRAERSYPDQRVLRPETVASLELRRSVRFRRPMTLFKRQMAPFRADARFAPLAERLGLLDYWRVDGNEPDFCATEPAPVCDML